jgi:hypothetical protein
MNALRNDRQRQGVSSESQVRAALILVGALVPVLALVLTARLRGIEIGRLVSGLLGYGPCVVLGLAFAAMSLSAGRSMIRQWSRYVGISVVAMVVGPIWWQMMDPTNVAYSSAQRFLSSILACVAISIVPSGIARAIDAYLHRRWLAIEYALIASSIVTILAASAGPRIVFNF